MTKQYSKHFTHLPIFFFFEYSAGRLEHAGSKKMKTIIGIITMAISIMDNGTRINTTMGNGNPMVTMGIGNLMMTMTIENKTIAIQEIGNNLEDPINPMWINGNPIIMVTMGNGNPEMNTNGNLHPKEKLQM